MKSFIEYLTESRAVELFNESTDVIKDKIGSKNFGIMKNADGVYFQIGNERFQSSKATADAILKVLKGGGTWKGKGGSGGKEAGIAIEGKQAYFKIGDETFILNTKARNELSKMFK